MLGIASKLPFRMTLRLRLTLLYGATFLIAGAGLLAITYALFSQSPGGSVAHIKAAPSVALGGHLPGSEFFINAGGGGSGASVKIPAGGTKLIRRPTGLSGRSQPPLPSRQLVADFLKYRREVRAFANHANFSIRQAIKTGNVQITAQRSTDKASLLLWSGVALGGMAVLSILLGWLVAGRALRPLRTMNQRAREITEESLHQRVGTEPRSDELGELAATFDALLERLERAFDAQRRFVANASHELRTPLTLERALVEVALADPGASVESLRRCCERVLVSSAQQERVIDALLTLARGQAGIEAQERVDLADLAAELLAARVGETANLTVEAKLDPAAVEGDPALLERMLANLIDNAIAHNRPKGGWISVQTGVEAGRPVLRVANSGQLVPPERLEELFEPFRRLDGERIGQDRGLGLGLSIVRAITLAHGAELDADARDQGGLEIEVRFSPATSPATGAPAAGSAVDRHLAGRVGVSL